MNQPIAVYETKTHRIEHFLPDQFEFRRDRGWLWAQRAAIWVLRRLGCYAIRTELVCTRHVIDARKILEALHRQNANLLQFYHERGERVLVGPNEFADLMDVSTPLSFEIPYSYLVNGDLKVFGMVITVVPWMSGVLVLPKLKEPCALRG